MKKLIGMPLIERVRPTVVVMMGAGAIVAYKAIQKLAEIEGETQAQVVTVATALIGSLLALGRDIIDGENKETGLSFWERLRPTISIIAIVGAVVACHSMQMLNEPDYVVTVAMAFSIAVISLGRDIVASDGKEETPSDLKQSRQSQ